MWPKWFDTLLLKRPMVAYVVFISTFLALAVAVAIALAIVVPAMQPS